MNNESPSRASTAGTTASASGGCLAAVVAVTALVLLLVCVVVAATSMNDRTGSSFLWSAGFFFAVVLYTGRLALKAALGPPPAARRPAPPSIIPVPSPHPTPPSEAQQRAERERMLVNAEEARVADRIEAIRERARAERPDLNGPKVIWTHPEVWAGDIGQADLDPNEQVHTAISTWDVLGGRPVATPSTAPLAAGGAEMLSWQEAEVSARDWMCHHGHRDAKLTPGGPDGGVDVIASGAIAQVKCWTQAVGPSPVLEFARVAQSSGQRKPLFFSVSGYTPNARAAAQAAGVHLYQLCPNGMSWTRVL